MVENRQLMTSLALLLPFLLFSSIPAAAVVYHSSPDANADEAGQLRTYIVQVLPPSDVPAAGDDLESYYRSFLPDSTTGHVESHSRLLYSYHKVFSGFAARLTEEELKTVAATEGFVGAYPNRLVPLQTTHTPDFLGLQLGNGFWNASHFGDGVIVGVLDTGVRPTHPSFSGDGLPPPPDKWKGICSFGSACNNKLIGARTMSSGRYQSAPLDEEGHGTHTASTAAGNFVRGVSAFGLAAGTAVGMAPRAHLAIYKVCNGPRGCASDDILAGLDAAVHDGVDVLSLSLGGDSVPFEEDPIAIGAFAAAERGIVVSCAGGNYGPKPASLSNEAPWILTVAASAVDRRFTATVKLGNGQEFVGESLDQPSKYSSKLLPLVYSSEDQACESPNMDVRDKAVFCKLGDVTPSVNVAAQIKAAGGAAVIFANSERQGYSIAGRRYDMPAASVSFDIGSNISSYAASHDKPTVAIFFNGTTTGVSPAPTIAYFSSRGPSQASPGILKPDISGPGLNILAAWPQDPEPGGNGGAKTFNIVSGTSMATPHLSGIAALVKSAHPDWSPAMIKSAIMTTSDTVANDKEPITDEQHKSACFFAMGAGHVNPSKAGNPGLVYDLDADDYIAYLCRMMTLEALQALTRRNNVSCRRNISEAELNYPSILVPLGSKSVTVNRTVTNVGSPNEAYTAEIDVPKGVSVTVTPKTLEFSKVNEKISFTVSVRHAGRTGAQGNLRWVSKEHVVRSPIVIAARPST